MSESSNPVIALLLEIREDLRTEIARNAQNVRDELRAEISVLRNDIRGEIAEFRNDIRGEIVELREHFEARLISESGKVRTELIGVRTDVMTRIERLSDSLRNIQEEAFVNFQATSQVRRAHDDIRKDIASAFEMIAAMERQVHRLQSEVRTLRGEH